MPGSHRGTRILNFFGLLAIPALIMLNALFVAAEYALVASRKTHVEEMVKNGDAGRQVGRGGLGRLDRSIAASQLGITLISIALGAVGEPLLAALFVPSSVSCRWTGNSTCKHSLATMAAVLLITLFQVILGEQVPKMTALQATDRTVLWLARPLNAFVKISLPILNLMNALSGWLFDEWA